MFVNSECYIYNTVGITCMHFRIGSSMHVLPLNLILGNERRSLAPTPWIDQELSAASHTNSFVHHYFVTLSVDSQQKVCSCAQE